MKKIIAFGVSFMPFLSSAQTFVATQAGGNVDNLVSFIRLAMNTATQLILGAAVVYLIWNVFGFVMAAGDEETRAQKRQGIIYGVIGVAVMVSIYGLIAFVTTSAGVTNTPITAPVAI